MLRYVLALCLLGGIATFAPTSLRATSSEESDGDRTATASASSDLVIFDNVAPNAGLNAAGASPASQYDAVFPFDAGAADDFVLPPSPQCTWVVTGIRWSGIYWGGATPGTITAFRIIIWPDSTGIPAGGNGATPNLAQAHAVYNIPGNANETLNAATSLQAYDYSADLPEPFQAHPGVRYWLQVQPAMTYPVQWGWHVTHNRQGLGPVAYFDLLGLPAWTQIGDPGDLGFQLLGEPHDLACDDGDACTENACVDGGCIYTAMTCDDGSACTDDSCDSATGCVFIEITCDDGSACTTDACDPATGCAYAPITCDDANACTDDTCDPATGCVFADITCDDGSECTTDSCDPVKGCVYTGITCNDDNACTDDTCDPATGCIFADITCDDGSECTTDSCDPVKGCAYTGITCNDDNACTDDTCDPATGCIFADITCDDGSECTTDSCDPVKGCVYTGITCNDDNACTDDTCDPATGCTFADITCDDGSECTTDSCDPATGCAFAPVECDDGDACTNDICDPLEGCVYTPVTCADSDLCTENSCDPATGCVFTSLLCDDGDTCTVDSCLDGACAHSKPPDFDGDGDVDLSDFQLVYTCVLSSADSADQSACPCTDLNEDGKSDLRDYAALQILFTGEK